MITGMDDLIALSRGYGSDPRWVVAGGGNTSLKTDRILYVKASGFPLAAIDENGFARMDRKKLAKIWTTDYPAGDDPVSVAERERRVLADQMAARIEGEERRPSVETLLHDLLPWPLVVHLHPTLVNGLTCGKTGKPLAREFFGDSHIWIPVTDPGYVLASMIRETLEERRAAGRTAPDYIILANHGVFVGGVDAGEIREKYNRMERILGDRIIRYPDAMPRSTTLPNPWVQWSTMARKSHGENALSTWVCGGELNRRLKSRAAAEPMTGCLTPDHIVYAGPGALYVDDPNNPTEDLKAYTAAWGKPPNVILLPDGALVVAAGEKALSNAVLLLENALELCAYAESFGGPRLLEERFIRFIVNWEVENYRSNLAS